MLGIATYLILSVAAPVPAVSTPPPVRLYYESLSGARLNPAGASTTITAGWRRRLVDAPPTSLLFADTYVWFAARASASPAAATLGLRLRAVPAAVLELEAGLDYLGFAGSFGNVMSFSSADADFSDAGRDAYRDAGRGYATSGFRATAQAKLQVAFGPIAVRSTFAGNYSDLSLRAQDEFFYDPVFDLVAPRRGLILRNDLDVAYLALPWVVGVRHAFLDSVLKTNGPTDAAIHRLGAVVAYRLFDDLGAGLARPTVILLVSWHLAHPYRAGTETSAAIPQTIVGLSFSGDLVPWGPAARSLTSG